MLALLRTILEIGIDYENKTINYVSLPKNLPIYVLSRKDMQV